MLSTSTPHWVATSRTVYARRDSGLLLTVANDLVMAHCLARFRLTLHIESTYILCMPRVAKAAHVLAKLRSQLGLYQREFAKRVGLSQRTIQDVERGILKLSRRSAIKVSEGTGVSVEWLLDNDSRKPIQNSSS